MVNGGCGLGDGAGCAARWAPATQPCAAASPAAKPRRMMLPASRGRTILDLGIWQETIFLIFSLPFGSVMNHSSLCTWNN